ncbi:hypothetical protein HCG49_15480 [Arenibacter sp. 6A1]|uniref:hypothetical protein n=1 Tax=Arenibacter sp. 6A1 TaxID=2720391 RepID=UPI0014450006|nr:hypothetical protein [Arenibacter sp. 6A1]NKI27962.1 hypothetical protein [Arenibacter sp. 6A1]
MLSKIKYFIKNIGPKSLKNHGGIKPIFSLENGLFPRPFLRCFFAEILWRKKGGVCYRGKTIKNVSLTELKHFKLESTEFPKFEFTALNDDHYTNENTKRKVMVFKT